MQAHSADFYRKAGHVVSELICLFENLPERRIERDHLARVCHPVKHHPCRAKDLLGEAVNGSFD